MPLMFGIKILGAGLRGIINIIKPLGDVFSNMWDSALSGIMTFFDFLEPVINKLETMMEVAKKVMDFVSGDSKLEVDDDSKEMMRSNNNSTQNTNNNNVTVHTSRSISEQGGAGFGDSLARELSLG